MNIDSIQMTSTTRIIPDSCYVRMLVTIRFGNTATEQNREMSVAAAFSKSQ